MTTAQIIAVILAIASQFVLVICLYRAGRQSGKKAADAAAGEARSTLRSAHRAEVADLQTVITQQRDEIKQKTRALESTKQTANDLAGSRQEAQRLATLLDELEPTLHHLIVERVTTEELAAIQTGARLLAAQGRVFARSGTNKRNVSAEAADALSAVAERISASQAQPIFAKSPDAERLDWLERNAQAGAEFENLSITFLVGREFLSQPGPDSLRAAIDRARHLAEEQECAA
ncbi:hypothetical protein ACSEQ4_11985 [Pseudomonas aeruginosa]